MDQTPDELVRTAVDTLLSVVSRSADDLRAFHDVVTKARRAPLPPLPRAAIVVTERIVDDLNRVEHDLREVLVAFGLADK